MYFLSWDSLMRALMNPHHKAPQLQGEQITDGIDISTWTINRPEVNLTYSVWDFAGQTVYYNTHQVIVTITKKKRVSQI